MTYRKQFELWVSFLGLVSLLLLIGPAEVLAQRCTPPPPGMFAWWPGDGNAEDLIGGRNGTWVGTPQFDTGMVDQAFRFGGSNWIEVADDPIFTLGSQPFTIDLWVNFRRLQGRDPFIGHDEGGGERNKFIFWFDISGHNKPRGPALRFHINSPTLPPLDPVYVPWTPALNRWYHVAVTRQGSLYRLFIDGVLVAADQDPNFIPDPRFPLTIGKAEAYRFDGLIDEVEMFDRALEPHEIEAIYLAGPAGKCKGIQLAVDIKPGSDPNSINCENDREIVPVAILSTEDFDARDVDQLSVTFEGASEVHLDSNGVPREHIEDVNGDGRFDRVFHFRLIDTALNCDSTEGTVVGQTLDGVPVEGTDAVRMVRGVRVVSVP